MWNIDSCPEVEFIGNDKYRGNKDAKILDIFQRVRGMGVWKCYATLF